MPGNFKNEDLRIKKTQSALHNALTTLLKRRNFAKITVNDLCEEAQICRVAFYLHYYDKYDLLQLWLAKLKEVYAVENHSDDTLRKMINQLISENTRIICNLLESANKETEELLQEFIFSLLNIPEEKNADNKLTQRYVTLYNFFSGGLLNLLVWQKNNGFPEDKPLFDNTLNEILNYIVNYKDKT